VRLRTRRRDDAPLVIFRVGIDHRDFQSVYQPNRVDAVFPVVESIVDFFESDPFKNANRVFERDAMQAKIAPVLCLVPKCSASSVFTQCKYKKWLSDGIIELTGLSGVTIGPHAVDKGEAWREVALGMTPACPFYSRTTSAFRSDRLR
jgi:hypothetical protein